MRGGCDCGRGSPARRWQCSDFHLLSFPFPSLSPLPFPSQCAAARLASFPSRSSPASCSIHNFLRGFTTLPST